MKQSQQTTIIRKPIKVKRSPAYSHETKFKTCELCYGHRGCCNYFDVKHHVMYVPVDYVDWNDLEIKIWEYRQQGHFIRLVIDRDIPSSILWAISYDHRNLLQVNIDLYQEYLSWIPNLAHAAERCGLYFVFVLHPIVPEFIKVSNVLHVIDSIRSIPHCSIMLKFAEFKNSGRLSTNTHININGKVIAKDAVKQYKPGVWGCTETFKHEFYRLVQEYAVPQHINVSVCGGVGF